MRKTRLIFAVALISLAGNVMALDDAVTDAPINMPIIQTKYTADPMPVVYNDTVYLYTSHDEDDAEGFKMKNWLLYTSTDMVNWHIIGQVYDRIDLPPGLSVWCRETANGICIVLSTDTA